MRPILVASIGVLSSLLALSCERPQAPNWHVELRLESEPPRTMEEVTFAVRVKSRTSEAVTGAEVELELSMASHPTGENRIRLRETEAGIYTGSGKFTMPGDWEVAVRIEKGGQRQVQRFSFQVK